LRVFTVACLIVLFSLAGTSPAAESPIHELFVCGWDEVFLLNFENGLDREPRRTWTWRGRQRGDLPDAFKTLFNTTDECKPYEGGTKVLITSSGDGVALVDRNQDRVLFYGRAPNAHSADLLPRNRLAVAASHRPAGKGDRLILFDVASPDREVWSDELPWGHGVVWDEQRQVLWALADEDIRTYELRDWESDSPSLRRTAATPLPEGGGHDLSPVPGTPQLAVTTASRAWLFDRNARTFQPHPQLGDRRSVKSISYHATTGAMAYLHAEGKNWWAERVHFLNPPGMLHVEGEHFYKARWNTR
jgi:hypothetical protein